MAVRINKPWQSLDADAVRLTSGQLGVYELADQNGETLYIGSAGGRSLFGLRGELESWLSKAAQYRLEVTTAYRTRHRELLMAYHADHGSYPPLNSPDETAGLGRLSP